MIIIEVWIVPKSFVGMVSDTVLHVAHVPHDSVCVVDECVVLIDRCSACFPCAVQ